MQLLKEQVKPYYSDDPSFTIVVNAPSKRDVANGQILSDGAGKAFNRILYKIGVRRRYIDQFAFIPSVVPGGDLSKVCKVTPKGNFKTCDEWDDLVRRFFELMYNVRTDLVVFLGALPLVALYGPDFMSIDSYRGYQIERDGKIIMPTYPPDRIMPGKGSHLQFIMRADILKGLRIAQHGRDAEPFDYYVPGVGWRNINL